MIRFMLLITMAAGMVAAADEAELKRKALRVAPSARVSITMKDAHYYGGMLVKSVGEGTVLVQGPCPVCPALELRFSEIKNLHVERPGRVHTALRRVRDGVYTVIIGPVFLIYCGLLNRQCDF